MAVCCCQVVALCSWVLTHTAAPLQVLTELAGTLDYMAPELLQRRYDQQADIWSAGVMLHELLTGRVPFEAKSCDQVGD